MSYQPLFDPTKKTHRIQTKAVAKSIAWRGDHEEQRVYVYDDAITFAINVALATARPLLVSGEPGTGKSSLAEDVAAKLGWRFYRKTISSRTQAQDLLFTIDAVRRLSDAQMNDPTLKDRVREVRSYLEPGVLWWAFAPESAAERGLDDTRRTSLGVSVANDPNEGKAGAVRAVVLLDEIDKADPDVPNDLLEPLGSFRFRLDGIDTDDPVVAAGEPPLVILTTNDERDLPRAFTRRCIALTLPPPVKKDRLVEIATAHFGAADDAIFREVADRFLARRQHLSERGGETPGTAEYLDAVRAAKGLGLDPASDEWKTFWSRIEEATLVKRRDPSGERGA